MKKIYVLLLLPVILLLMTGCSTVNSIFENNEDAGGKAADASFADTGNTFIIYRGDDIRIEDKEFADRIFIFFDPEINSSNRGNIIFSGCTFSGSIEVSGDRAGWVRFTNGCKFADGVTIQCRENTKDSAKKAKEDDAYMNVVFVANENTPYIETEAFFRIISDKDILLNGYKYTKADFEEPLFSASHFYSGNEERVTLAGILS